LPGEQFKAQRGPLATEFDIASSTADAGEKGVSRSTLLKSCRFEMCMRWIRVAFQSQKKPPGPAAQWQHKPLSRFAAHREFTLFDTTKEDHRHAD